MHRIQPQTAQTTGSVPPGFVLRYIAGLAPVLGGLIAFSILTGHLLAAPEQVRITAGGGRVVSIAAATGTITTQDAPAVPILDHVADLIWAPGRPPWCPPAGRPGARWPSRTGTGAR